MIRVRTRRVAVAAILGVMLLGAAAAAFLFARKHEARARAQLMRSSAEPGFRFERHTNAGSSAAHASLRSEASWLKEFTSNIPVLVLRAVRPGPVSGSKKYSSFTMEVYEPKQNEPTRLTDAPVLTAPVGLRLHGMVSRQFPKLSYRLELRDPTGASQAKPLLGL